MKRHIITLALGLLVAGQCKPMFEQPNVTDKTLKALHEKQTKIELAVSILQQLNNEKKMQETMLRHFKKTNNKDSIKQAKSLIKQLKDLMDKKVKELKGLGLTVKIQ